MDDAYLGQAMGEHYREEMAKRAIAEAKELHERVTFLEEMLTEVIDTLSAHGIYSVRS